METYLMRIATALETIAAAMQLSTDSPASIPAKKVRKKTTEADTVAPAAVTPPPIDQTLDAAGVIPVEPKAAEPLTIAKVAEYVRSIVNIGPAGHGKAAELLQKFGAKRLSELKIEQYAEVVKGAKAILDTVKEAKKA